MVFQQGVGEPGIFMIVPGKPGNLINIIITSITIAYITMTTTTTMILTKPSRARQVLGARQARL